MSDDEPVWLGTYPVNKQAAQGSSPKIPPCPHNSPQQIATTQPSPGQQVATDGSSYTQPQNAATQPPSGAAQTSPPCPPAGEQYDNELQYLCSNSIYTQAADDPPPNGAAQVATTQSMFGQRVAASDEDDDEDEPEPFDWSAEPSPEPQSPPSSGVSFDIVAHRYLGNLVVIRPSNVAPPQTAPDPGALQKASSARLILINTLYWMNTTKSGAGTGTEAIEAAKRL